MDKTTTKVFSRLRCRANITVLLTLTIFSSSSCSDLQSGQRQDKKVGVSTDPAKTAPAPQSMRTLAPPVVELTLDTVDERAIRHFVAPEWESFDKTTGDKRWPGGQDAIWLMKVSPPLPNTWPPSSARGFTYYLYAEYESFNIPCGNYLRSEPWGKVIVRQDGGVQKQVLRNTIGKPMHDFHCHAISSERAKRLIQIRENGQRSLPALLTWKTLPVSDDDAVKAIRDYYCQWQLEDKTVQFVMNSHRAFFDWLSCPAPLFENEGVVP